MQTQELTPESHRLIGISGSTTATFSYDALDRRLAKTINGATTTYLYDGADVVTEAGATNASYLSTLNIDEPLVRQTASGNEYYHTDDLGSTVALSDDSGSVTTRYAYGPFGSTTVTGTSTNPFQFTGREHDGTGLYYYRARYYSPSRSRFLSEDPLEFGTGETNLYGYAGNNPLHARDPLGLYSVDNFVSDAGNFAAGFGDTLSFGATNYIRDLMGSNSAVNQSSGLYNAGVGTGVAAGLGFGASTLGRHAIANGAGSILSEGRTFGTVSKNWHATWKGKYDLDHMFFSRKNGGANAGWNLVPLSPWVNQVLLNPGSFFWNANSKWIPQALRRFAQVGVAGLYGALPTSLARRKGLIH